METRPPLGVMPKKIFEEKRIEDLARAIYEYVNFNPNCKEIIVWTNELIDRLEDYQK